MIRPSHLRGRLAALSCGWLLVAVLCNFEAVAACAAEAPVTVTPAEFQARVQALDKLIASCQQSVSAATCQSDQVGPDVQLAVPGGHRSVRFDWLRDLLATAAKPESAKTSKQANAPGDYEPPTLQQQLADARQRLAEEAKLASESAAQTQQKVHVEHKALTAILAGREYSNDVAKRSIRDRILERIGNWIDRLLSKIAEAGSRSPWIGITAEILFVLALCVALVWFLIRLERQGRFSSEALAFSTGPAAASARDWQLWLADAQAAASRSAWRDAIHLLYWASISRLESNGLWPADRARTPREYLALLGRENPHQSQLKALTRSFERTWYAGGAATQADFKAAETLTAELTTQSRGTRMAEPRQAGTGAGETR